MIKNIADFVVFELFHIWNSHLAQALNFFIYDTIKIFFLLVLIVNLMTLINHFLPIERIREFLAKNKFYGFDYFLSSIFGAITPFCSCSSIPMFVWFLRAGIPLWITFAFLITSPLVNEVAIAMLIWLFGWKISLIYAISWILLWTLWWWILWKLKMEDQIYDFVFQWKVISSKIVKFEPLSFLRSVIKDSFELIFKIMPYVLIWIAIWWLIHGFVPEWFLQAYIKKDNIFAIPLAVILWVPMYANAAWVIPIIKSLIVAGVPLGAALAFMMAVVWLSLPEFLILKKVMKIKLLLIFFGLVSFFMMLIWYLFNWLF